MSRLQRRQRRGGGRAGRKDTPVRAALSRRDTRRRLVSLQHCEALCEEAEMEEAEVHPGSLLLQRAQPDSCAPVFHLSRPARVTQEARGQLIPDTVSHTQTFKGAEEGIKKDEEILAVTPESSPSSSLQPDSASSSDDDDDDDDDVEEEEECSVSTASSSLSSPEIFRREIYALPFETCTDPTEEELLDLNVHIKNSTLLDASHAVSIHMHQPPNLSNITDASALLHEHNLETDQHGRHGSATKRQTDPNKSVFIPENQSLFSLADKPLQRRTPPIPTGLRPTLYKKKVRFQSPAIVHLDVRHPPSTKTSADNATEPVGTSTGHRRNDGDEVVSSLLTVRLRSSAKDKQHTATFFDFFSDDERDAFFHMMRQRCTALRRPLLFPLTATNSEDCPCDV